MGVEIPEGGDSTPKQETAPPAEEDRKISEQPSNQRRNIGIVLISSAIVLAVILALVPDWDKEEATKAAIKADNKAETNSKTYAKVFDAYLPVFGSEFS